MDALVDWVEAWISKRFDQGKGWLQWGSGKPLGTALAALVQLGGAPPPQPVMEGSGRSAYAIPSDGDTPILQFQTSTGDSVRLLIDTGASRSMVSRALIARLQLPTRKSVAATSPWLAPAVIAQRIHRARRCCPRCSWENSRSGSWRYW